MAEIFIRHCKANKNSFRATVVPRFFDPKSPVLHRQSVKGLIQKSNRARGFPDDERLRHVDSRHVDLLYV